jgi:hypothetical protein
MQTLFAKESLHVKNCFLKMYKYLNKVTLCLNFLENGGDNRTGGWVCRLIHRA